MNPNKRRYKFLGDPMLPNMLIFSFDLSILLVYKPFKQQHLENCCVFIPEKVQIAPTHQQLKEVISLEGLKWSCLLLTNF